jgi:hypothetical protein
MRFLLPLIVFTELTLGGILPLRPVIRFAGYLGGRQKDLPNAVALDREGYIYVVGQTDSQDFPSTPQALRTRSGVNNDDWIGFAAKISPGASRVVYSTFIGGSYRTVVNAVAADQFGDAFVAGTTCSSNFPATANAFQTRAPGGGKGIEGCDAFVAKLDPTGSRYLYATYLGGSGADTATSLWVDPNGNAWVAGFTSSPDFPATRDAMTPHLRGARDGFLAELDPKGEHLLYGTYVGGSKDDAIQSIASSGDGILYLSGVSNSEDFLRSGRFEDSKGFVLPFSLDHRSPAGPVLPMGGTGYSTVSAVAIGANADIFVAGTTASRDFPTTADAFKRRLAGRTEAFWARLHQDKQSGRLRVLYATLVGGSQETSGDAIAVDRDGAVTLAGRTTSTDFPVTPTALVKRLSRHEDGYIARFSTALPYLQFAGFLAGGTLDTTWSEGVKGLASDGNGNLYAAAMVNEPAFSGIPCALAPHPAGNTEVFLLELTFVEHQLLQPRRRETACRPRTSAGPDESRGSG